MQIYKKYRLLDDVKINLFVIIFVLFVLESALYVCS